MPIETVNTNWGKEKMLRISLTILHGVHISY
jgi:hypothetical protein